MSKKKIIKITIICLVFAALLAGLITMMVLPQKYGKPDKLGVGGDSSFGERVWIGVQVALLGLGTVFVMLALLILMVTVLRLIFEGVAKLKEARAAKKQESIQSQGAVALEENSNDDDEEVVAVIMAALNAYYETQNVSYKSNLKFRVRSIKEI